MGVKIVKNHWFLMNFNPFFRFLNPLWIPVGLVGKVSKPPRGCFWCPGMDFDRFWSKSCHFFEKNRHFWWNLKNPFPEGSSLPETPVNGVFWEGYPQGVQSTPKMEKFHFGRFLPPRHPFRVSESLYATTHLPITPGYLRKYPKK